MIERVARAQAGERWNSLDEEHKSAARDLARAAIEAMQEVTEEMKDSPQRFCLNKDETKCVEYYAAYRCYIDAALK